MPDKQTFEAVLTKHKNMEATGITIPFDVEKEFGAKRVPVIATINGAEYRGSIVRMGGSYMLGIPKEFRDRAGIAAGDSVEVIVEKDIAPRTVSPPEDLRAALEENGVAEAFSKLSYTHQKEHVRSIEEAKAPETRARRISKTLEMLKK